MSEMTPVAIEGALACDYAGETAIGLLDALIDAMTFAKPGVDAHRTATELARLADGAGYVAQELEALLQLSPRPLDDKEAEDAHSEPRTASAR